MARRVAPGSAHWAARHPVRVPLTVGPVYVGVDPVNAGNPGRFHERPECRRGSASGELRLAPARTAAAAGEQPIQYVGGELGAVIKDWDSGACGGR